MRILVGHNYYRQPGGEDGFFRSEVAMFKACGQEVCVYERHNDEIKPGIVSLFSHAASMRFSQSSYEQVSSLIRSFKPQVAHFHNFFYVMTPSVLYACKDEGLPVVVSLHNFRLMCANGLFFRGGKPCEDCMHGMRISSIIHRCQRSLAFSVLTTDVINYHWQKKTWDHAVDHYVVETQFTKNKYVQAGLDADKISVIPNFIQEPARSAQNKGNYALYAGRLRDEKGVDHLLQAWRYVKDFPLYIAGQGPMQKDVEAYIKEHHLTHVKLLGFLENEDYAKILAQARFLIVPSVCYENFPRVVVEAYAQGLPVVANRLGTLAEVVKDGITGLLYSQNDPQDLAAKAMALFCDEKKYAQLCVNARQAYDLNYTPARHYEGLTEVYRKLTGHS